MTELTQDAAIAWLLKAPALTEDRAIEIMLDVCARLYGLTLDQQAHVIATIGAFIAIEANDPGAALADLTAMMRRQVEAYIPEPMVTDLPPWSEIKAAMKKRTTP